MALNKIVFNLIKRRMKTDSSSFGVILPAGASEKMQSKGSTSATPLLTAMKRTEAGRWLKQQRREVPLSDRAWLYGIEKAARHIRQYRTIILDTSGVNDTDDVPDFFIRNNNRLVAARNFQ